MQTPLVSIIIPTYNRAHLIGETLDSVLVQTYKNWECIVVDDGSTDNTDILMAKYIAKDPRFQYHHRPTDRLQGGNAARNYGFEISKGEYVQWFDSDDLMLHEFIATKLNLFDNGIKLVICSSSYVDSCLSNLEPIDLEIKWNLYKDYVLWDFKIVTNNVMFKREFLSNKKLFNSHILRGQEAEFFSRIFFELSIKDYKLINVPLFLYRQHADTKTTANNSYIPKFKKDQIDLLIENFKRTLKTNDIEFQKKLYRGIVMKFFQAIENHSPENGRIIIKKMTPILGRINIYFGFKFYILGYFSLFINKKSDKIKNKFMSIRFS